MLLTIIMKAFFISRDKSLLLQLLMLIDKATFSYSWRYCYAFYHYVVTNRFDYPEWLERIELPFWHTKQALQFPDLPELN